MTTVPLSPIARKLTGGRLRVNGRGPGLERALRIRSAWLDSWHSHGIEIEEITDAGDDVIASVHLVELQILHQLLAVSGGPAPDDAIRGSAPSSHSL